MTAGVLVGYCYGLVFVGLFSFLQRFFYALGDYKTPTIAAGVVLVVDVGLSLWLKETALRVAGLAVANSAAFTVGAVMLLVAASRRLGGLDWRRITTTVGKTVLTCLPVGIGLALALSRFGDAWQTGSTLRNFGILILLGGISAAVVVGLYVVLRVEIVHAAVTRRRSRERGAG
jgi:putative peptidoglycan lipid II flippase